MTPINLRFKFLTRCLLGGLLFVCLLAFLPELCIAQNQDTLAPSDTLNLEKVESRSEALFEANDWKALRLLGDSALAAGIDYFELRRRIGYSYFVEFHYEEAIPHLSAAIKMGPYDRFVIEQLQHAYQVVGLMEDSRRICAQFSKADRAKNGIRAIIPLRVVGVEPGIALSGTPKAWGNRYSTNFTFRSYVGFRTESFQGLKLSIQGLPTGRLHQLGCYLNPHYYLGKKFWINFTYHYERLSGKESSDSPDSIASTRITRFVTNAHTFRFGIDHVFLSANLHAYGCLAPISTVQKVQPSFASPIVNDSSNTFLVKQIGCALDWSPKIKQSYPVRFTHDLFLHLNGSNPIFCFFQGFWFRLSMKNFIEFSFLKAGTSYFSELEAKSVYNYRDALNVRYGVRAILSPRKKHWWIDVGYFLERRLHSENANPFSYSVHGLRCGFYFFSLK